MKNITCLGAGRVGATMALDLAREGEFLVTVADVSEQALGRLCSPGRPGEGARPGLAGGGEGGGGRRGPGGGRGSGLHGLPHHGSSPGGRQAHGGHLLLRGGPVPPGRPGRGSGASPPWSTAGVAPGCDNLILGAMERELDSVDPVRVPGGGAARGAHLAVRIQGGVLAGGRAGGVHPPGPLRGPRRGGGAPALSEVELVDFPGVGTLEAFNTDGLRTLLHTVAAPFKKEKTLRYPGHAEKMRLLRESRASWAGAPVRVGGRPGGPRRGLPPAAVPLWQHGGGRRGFHPHAGRGGRDLRTAARRGAVRPAGPLRPGHRHHLHGPHHRLCLRGRGAHGRLRAATGARASPRRSSWAGSPDAGLHPGRTGRARRGVR